MSSDRRMNWLAMLGLSVCPELSENKDIADNISGE